MSSYHLYHKKRAVSAEATAQNMRILENTLEQKLIRCEKGLALHLNPRDHHV